MAWRGHSKNYYQTRRSSWDQTSTSAKKTRCTLSHPLLSLPHLIGWRSHPPALEVLDDQLLPYILQAVHIPFVTRYIAWACLHLHTYLCEAGHAPRDARKGLRGDKVRQEAT